MQIVDKKLVEIAQLYRRLSLGLSATDGDAVSDEQADANRKPKAAVEAIKVEAGAVVSSDLLQKSPKLLPMAVKFVARLEEKVAEMQAQAQRQDYASLADNAHWLKGSAGTLGFHQFTDPAAELEQSAKSEQAEQVAQWLVMIESLKRRVVLPEPSPPSQSKEPH